MPAMAHSKIEEQIRDGTMSLSLYSMISEWGVTSLFLLDDRGLHPKMKLKGEAGRLDRLQASF